MNNRNAVIEQHRNAVTTLAAPEDTLLVMPKQRGAPVKPKDPDAVAIGRRLRGIMAEWRIETVDRFAEIIGTERNRVSNWLNGENPPPLLMAIRIKRAFPSVTLDWIYCGNHETLQGWLGLRLLARFEGRSVPEATIDGSLPPGATQIPTEYPATKAPQAQTPVDKPKVGTKSADAAATRSRWKEIEE